MLLFCILENAFFYCWDRLKVDDAQLHNQNARKESLIRTLICELICGDKALWVETAWNRRVHFIDMNLFPMSSGGSERMSAAASGVCEWSGLCEASKCTSGAIEWASGRANGPVIYVLITYSFNPECKGWWGGGCIWRLATILFFPFLYSRLGMKTKPSWRIKEWYNKNVAGQKCSWKEKQQKEDRIETSKQVVRWRGGAAWWIQYQRWKHKEEVW